MTDFYCFHLEQIKLRCAFICAVLLLVTLPVCAQAPFRPPPPPQPVAVRGLGVPPASEIPAQVITPTPVTPSAVTSSPITPTLSSKAQPLEGGEIVARVDGQIVLASDVLWQVNQLIAANRDRIPPDQLQEAKRALMRQQVMGLLDTKMIYADFRRTVPAENLPSIQENLQEPFEKNEIPRLVKMLKMKDRNELSQLLEESGTSLDDLRRQFIERTIAGEWLRQMVPKPKEATYDDLVAYYQEHKQEYEYPAQVKWEEVMISIDRSGGDRTKAWQAITALGNDAWQRAQTEPGLRGQIFTEIAKQKSHGFTAQQGGLHGWTEKGALRSQEIDQALFTLQIGQLSNVIESQRGFHIVRVLERKQAGCTPFTEAQKLIRQELGRNQKKGLAQAEVAKLRKKSRIWTLFDGDPSGPALSRNRQPTQQR